MILSMTGYGKAESRLRDHKKVVVEIRSLNSKTLDLNMRLASQVRGREIDIRNLIARRVERGKVDLSISYQDTANPDAVVSSFSPINTEAFRYYLATLRELEKENNLLCPDLVGTILRLPDVLKPNDDTAEADDTEWQVVLSTINAAIDAFVAFRTQEGAALERMFTEKLDGISTLLTEVEPFEQGRVGKIRQHLLSNLDKLAEETKQKIDMNRLEQEMIYYLEKLDVTEEKVRLTNHIRYFRETMGGDGTGVGKKLGFISQEMGREINTLGSKSNQSEMQIIVVKMKDILEQIKEQVLNVL